jgi:hypothetical protein
MKRTRSAWHHQEIGSVVAIYDDFSGTEMSVTNDAEQVIEALRSIGIDFTGKRVIYRDTDGQWDEMRIANGEFAGFASIGQQSLDAALKKVGAV